MGNCCIGKNHVSLYESLIDKSESWVIAQCNQDYEPSRKCFKYSHKWQFKAQFTIYESVLFKHTLKLFEGDISCEYIYGKLIINLVNGNFIIINDRECLHLVESRKHQSSKLTTNPHKWKLIEFTKPLKEIGFILQ